MTDERSIQEALSHLRAADSHLAMAQQKLPDSHEMRPALRSARERVRAIEGWLESELT